MPHKNLYLNVHSGTLTIAKNYVQPKCPSIDECINKINMVRILFGDRNKLNIDTYCNMNKI